VSMGRAGIYTVDANPSARPGPRVGPDGDESRPCEDEFPDIELSRMSFAFACQAPRVSARRRRRTRNFGKRSVTLRTKRKR